MLKPRTRRRIYRELAYLFEAWAEALHQKAQRPARPRPLRFPTAGELMMNDLVRRSVRLVLSDLEYVGRSPLWDKAIGDSVKIRIPSDYSPRRIDAD